MIQSHYIHPQFARSLAFLGMLLLAASIPIPVGAQTFEVVHDFSYPDGSGPSGGLIIGSDGNFYGTTSGGGTNGNFGTVFRLSSEGTLTSLASFNGTNGARPVGCLVQGSDGWFYGTTVSGGTNDFGTIFRISTNGALTSLVSFTNWAQPYGGLVAGPDGQFYGTTHTGGQYGCGSAFKMTPAGILTTLVSFEFHDPRGTNPRAGLTWASDGNFYGTTTSGGGGFYGTIFQLSTSGVVNAIHSFDGNMGFYPACRLLESHDGRFYGMAAGGVLFSVRPDGDFTVFTNLGHSSPALDAALLETSDGNFYGATVGGGRDGDEGTIFLVSRSGAFTPLVSLFYYTYRSPRTPSSGLIVGKDGNFYGTTAEGGVNNQGAVYRLNMPILTCTVSGTNAILSWSAKVTGFTLQSTADLPQAALWSDVPNPPVIVGSEFRVTNAPTSDRQFYRLKK